MSQDVEGSFLMIKTSPRLGYCGLTVVVSNPSRFDLSSLCSGNGGIMFNQHCLRPELNTMQCEFREADDTSPLRDGTKCLLLMGEYAMHKWCPQTAKNTLNEMRGSLLLTASGMAAIASFFYQDCVDIKDDESELNTQSRGYRGEAEDEKQNEQDIKRYSNTARSNYAFWLRADTRKCKAILQNGGQLPPRKYTLPTYKIYPPAEEVINVLRSHKDCWMDFDMETDYVDGNPHCRNLLCFSFSFDNGHTVYSVPILNHEYRMAYTDVPYIMRALSIGIRDNTVVAHNGAGFDFLVLGHKYHIPVVRTYDTMIAMHRCFPDIEKSLGHCTSYWLWEQFHKDENPGVYRSHDDMMKMLRYCGKDVYTMSCIRQEITEYSKHIPGLTESIATAMKSIRPYLTTSLHGIRYSEEMRQSKIKENDRLMTHYLRMIKLLIGDEGMRETQSAIKDYRKAGSFPSSNKQCVKYFHDLLGYPVVYRNPPDQNGVRNPSLAAKHMFKLRLKRENPVIDLTLAFRQTKLETSTPLGFLAWKDNNNKNPLPPNYDSPLTQQTNSQAQGTFTGL